ncbi:hypothetical protein [Paucibacter soli]|uniref:hypothetical protein n=1 Tax=Paucibacter soli TaxID=3133433 RepID=UPI0030B1AD63
MTKFLKIAALAALLATQGFGAHAQNSAQEKKWSPLVCFWNLTKCEEVKVTASPQPEVPLTWNHENATSMNPLRIQETADNWVKLGEHELGDGTVLKVYSDGAVRREMIPGEVLRPDAGDVIFNGKVYSAPKGGVSRGIESDAIQPTKTKVENDMKWGGQEWVCQAGYELSREPVSGTTTCKPCEQMGKVWNGGWCVCPPGMAWMAGACYPGYKR